MQITLSSRELDEVVLLWLKAQGFSPDNYGISIRRISGRSDGPLGNRIECTLEPILVPHLLDKIPPKGEFTTTSFPTSVVTIDENPWAEPTEAVKIPVKFGQGHADE